MGFFSISSRFRMDFVRISCGFLVSIMWISCGVLVDFFWISSGFLVDLFLSTEPQNPTRNPHLDVKVISRASMNCSSPISAIC